MILKKILVFGLIVCATTTYAQNHPDSIAVEKQSKWFNFMVAEFPNVSISGEKIISQQFNIGSGYQFNQNFSLFYNVALGLIGENPKIPGFSNTFAHIGLGSDYMFKLNKNRMLGLEVLVGYSDRLDSKSYDINHWVYQVGIKSSYKMFNVAGGVRYRDFYYHKLSSSEVYISLGFKMPMSKLKK